MIAFPIAQGRTKSKQIQWNKKCSVWGQEKEKKMDKWLIPILLGFVIGLFAISKAYSADPVPAFDEESEDVMVDSRMYC